MLLFCFSNFIKLEILYAEQYAIPIPKLPQMKQLKKIDLTPKYIKKAQVIGEIIAYIVGKIKGFFKVL